MSRKEWHRHTANNWVRNSALHDQLLADPWGWGWGRVLYSSGNVKLNYGWAAIYLVAYVLPSWTFPWKLDVLPCLGILVCSRDMSRDHFIRKKKVNGKWLIGGENSFYWSINKRSRCKFKLSTLLRLPWFLLISYVANINYQKSNFDEKRTFQKIMNWHLKRGFTVC